MMGIKEGVWTKTWTHIRALKGVIDVFKRTEGKGAMYLSSDRICYRYGAQLGYPSREHLYTWIRNEGKTKEKRKKLNLKNTTEHPRNPPAEFK